VPINSAEPDSAAQVYYTSTQEESVARQEFGAQFTARRGSGSVDPPLSARLTAKQQELIIPQFSTRAESVAQLSARSESVSQSSARSEWVAGDNDDEGRSPDVASPCPQQQQEWDAFQHFKKFMSIFTGVQSAPAVRPYGDEDRGTSGEAGTAGEGDENPNPNPKLCIQNPCHADLDLPEIERLRRDDAVCSEHRKRSLSASSFHDISVSGNSFCSCSSCCQENDESAQTEDSEEPVVVGMRNDESFDNGRNSDKEDSGVMSGNYNFSRQRSKDGNLHQGSRLTMKQHSKGRDDEFVGLNRQQEHGQCAHQESGQALSGNTQCEFRVPFPVGKFHASAQQPGNHTGALSHREHCDHSLHSSPAHNCELCPLTFKTPAPAVRKFRHTPSLPALTPMRRGLRRTPSYNSSATRKINPTAHSSIDSVLGRKSPAQMPDRQNCDFTAKTNQGLGVSLQRTARSGFYYNPNSIEVPPPSPVVSEFDCALLRTATVNAQSRDRYDHASSQRRDRRNIDCSPVVQHKTQQSSTADTRGPYDCESAGCFSPSSTHSRSSFRFYKHQDSAPIVNHGHQASAASCMQPDALGRDHAFSEEPSSPLQSRRTSEGAKAHERIGQEWVSSSETSEEEEGDGSQLMSRDDGSDDDDDSQEGADNLSGRWV
jgi:hypothetical protein